MACEYVTASRKLAPLGLNQRQSFADLKRLVNVWSLALPMENLGTNLGQNLFQ